MPSTVCTTFLSSTPAIARIVENKSSTITGFLETDCGRTTVGHFTTKGIRIPPSYTDPLPDRNGALCVSDSPPLGGTRDNPPLSDKKKITVFPDRLFFSR